jgi:hypothetical protein
MKKLLFVLFSALMTAGLIIGLGSQFAKTQAQSLPTFMISYQQMPNIAMHVYQAMQSGKPWKLTYIGADNDYLNDRNRSDACKYMPSPRPTGYECDEYPFASTYQGGTGSSAVLVPAHENHVQGGQLSTFYRSNNLRNGNQFLVGINW